MSAHRPIRVGLVGANSERGWARDAHLPALRRLPEAFAICAVSARTQEIADQAAAAFGAPRAYDDSLQLARDPEVDLVVVAVKVPEHRAVVLAAIEAGKHVYCEWPLGLDVAEAEEMQKACRPGRHAVIGLQGLCAPAVRQAAKLVLEGAIGRPRVLRVRSPTAGWGTEVLRVHTYLQDRRNGATVETIVGGHTMAAMEAIVGAYREVDARTSILHPRVGIQGSAEMIERSCADHVTVMGLHESGCVSTLEVVSGTFTTPFLFELDGEHGRITISGGDPGGYQAGVLTLETGVACEPQPKPVVPGLGGPAANVAELYARLGSDIRTGTHSLADFAAGVRLSRLLKAVERASTSGRCRI